MRSNIPHLIVFLNNSGRQRVLNGPLFQRRRALRASATRVFFVGRGLNEFMATIRAVFNILGVMAS